MKLKTLVMTGFKRFKQTTITGLSQDVKLIVLIGPNGCGKTSVFEALNVWRNKHTGHLSFEREYYLRDEEFVEQVAMPVPILNQFGRQEGYENRSIERKTLLDQNNSVVVDFHFGDNGFVGFREATDYLKSVYLRPSHRNQGDFRSGGIGHLQSALQEKRFNKLTDTDTAVSQNFSRVVAKSVENLYNNNNNERTARDIREELIGKVASAFNELFPDMTFEGVDNVFSAGTFRFSKGNTKNYMFGNLSSGERAAFDLILDLIVKLEEYDNTIYCFDEPEAHVNPLLHGKLLQTLYNNIPDNGQLIVATHSVGMIKKAAEIAKSFPEQVAFLNFYDRDFDVPQVITPVTPSRELWKNIFREGFADYADLIAPSKIVICEGPHVSDSSIDDAKIFQKIFAVEFPDVNFICGGNCHEVRNNENIIFATLTNILPNSTVIRLTDRDYLSDDEIIELKKKNIRVLGLRHIESYVFSDEIIEKVYKSYGKSDDELADILGFKKQILADSAASHGKAVDDVKNIARKLLVKIRNDCKFSQGGSSLKAFMRDTLANFITSETETYATLRMDIFGV